MALSARYCGGFAYCGVRRKERSDIAMPYRAASTQPFYVSSRRVQRWLGSRLHEEAIWATPSNGSPGTAR